MKKCLNALLFVASIPVAFSLHAQTADGALAQSRASTMHGFLERPLVIGGVLLALVVLSGFVVVLWRRGAGKGDVGSFENTYDNGFDTIQPTRAPRKDPNLRPLSLHTVTGARTDTVVAPWGIPADFDVPRFLRKSKSAFVRMQAAWDRADLNDIRRFTSKELFGEFFRQIGDRAGAPAVTEVVTLGAELHSVETADGYYIARVKFSGMIKEDAGPVTPFSETWELSKPLDGHRSWIVAGIEQA